ncbi:MAG: helix-turn-helix domain-containing protein [Pseudobdellovibrionaceae bacterium]
MENIAVLSMRIPIKIRFRYKAQMGIYNTGRKRHHDVCYTFDVFAPKSETDKIAEHRGWEINYTPDTKCFTNIDMKLRGTIFNCNPQEFLFFNANEVHTEVYAREADSRSLAIVFPSQFLRHILEESGIEPDEVIFDKINYALNPKISQLLDLLFQLRNADYASSLIYDCTATELVMHLLENSNSSASGRLKSEFSKGYYPSLVSKTKRMISQGFEEESFSLDQLAGEVGLSKFHLIRSFKAATGASPIQFLNALRIEKAKLLLRTTETSVSDVALASGFSTFSAFNKSFKRSTGLAPLSFRNSKV